MHLFHKSVVIDSTSSSNISKVESYLSKYGDENEKQEVQQAFHRCLYRVHNGGNVTSSFFNY